MFDAKFGVNNRLVAIWFVRELFCKHLDYLGHRKKIIDWLSATSAKVCSIVSMLLNDRCPVMLVAGDYSPHLNDTVAMNARLNPSESTWMKVICIVYLSWMGNTVTAGALCIHSSWDNFTESASTSCCVARWRSVYGVGLATERSRVQSLPLHCRVQLWTSCSHTLSSTSGVTTLWRYINQFKLKTNKKQLARVNSKNF